jgi:hypothetical protein
MNIAMGMLALTVVMTGWGSQYAPGVMDKVIATRQAGLTSMDLPMDVSGYDGYVAVLDCSWIGREVWIKPVEGDTWERFLVTDCAGIADGGATWMIEGGIIAEFDYESAVRLDTVGHGIQIQMAVLDYKEVAWNTKDQQLFSKDHLSLDAAVHGTTATCSTPSLTTRNTPNRYTHHKSIRRF